MNALEKYIVLSSGVSTEHPGTLTFYSLNYLMNLVKPLFQKAVVWVSSKMLDMLEYVVEFLRHYKKQRGTEQQSDNLASVSREICTVDNEKLWGTQECHFASDPNSNPVFPCMLRATQSKMFLHGRDISLLPRPAKEACASFFSCDSIACLEPTWHDSSFHNSSSSSSNNNNNSSSSSSSSSSRAAAAAAAATNKNKQTNIQTKTTTTTTSTTPCFPCSLLVGAFSHQIFIFWGWKCMPRCFCGWKKHLQGVQCPRVQVGTNEWPFWALKIPNRSNSLKIWDLR